MDINNFFCTWLALDIAQEHCHEKHEQVYKNFIFKDNVDIDKVMGKLTEYVKDKTLKSQKHWYVVYRVFEKKKWLKYKLTQKAFRDQMNAAFERVLKSTEEDFRKVGKYFKVKEYADWTLDDGKAPSCCKEYRGIADTLDQEFQDKKYAKPGTLINTRKIEKLR